MPRPKLVQITALPAAYGMTLYGLDSEGAIWQGMHRYTDNKIDWSQVNAPTYTDEPAP